MLVELIAGLVGLVPPAVKYVASVLGSEALDRRAKRLENGYGGLFQKRDAKLIGDIASTSALLARFDAIAKTIETPRKTKSSAVSGVLSAVAFYVVMTFLRPGAEDQTLPILAIAAGFIALALGSSIVWDHFYTVTKIPEKYSVQIPRGPEPEAQLPPVRPGKTSYREARSSLQGKMLSQMSGVMHVLSKSEILGRYADNSTPRASKGATDEDGKPYAPYAWEVTDLLKKTKSLEGAEAALPYIVSQRDNPRFRHTPLNLAHAGKIYRFEFTGNDHVEAPTVLDRTEFTPRGVEANVAMWEYRTQGSVERWRKGNIHVDSAAAATFWLPPEVQLAATRPEKTPIKPDRV